MSLLQAYQVCCVPIIELHMIDLQCTYVQYSSHPGLQKMCVTLRASRNFEDNSPVELVRHEKYIHYLQAISIKLKILASNSCHLLSYLRVLTDEWLIPVSKTSHVLSTHE